MPELLLYPGNLCNRDCAFCCVDGSPDGTFEPFSRDIVSGILRLIRPDARIKLYGGEPTLHYRHCIDVVRSLRERGYRGRLTVFSNGIQAERLIDILEADPPTASHPGSDAYLNHYIWHGLGVPPLPHGRRGMLEAWAEVNPGRLWLSHSDVLPVGAARRTDWRRAVDNSGSPSQRNDFGGRCARCFPTVRSDGTVHACAFAVESEARIYELGSIDQDAASLSERHRAFLGWVTEVLEPAALASGESPCTVCLRWAEQSDARARSADGDPTADRTELGALIRSLPVCSAR